MKRNYCFTAASVPAGFGMASGIASAANDAIKEVGDIMSYFDTSNLNSYRNQLSGIVSSAWNTPYNSYNDILNAKKYNGINSIRYNQEAWNGWDWAKKIGQRTVEGAAIGTSFVPGWGTLIGTAAGLVDGTIQGIIGSTQAKKHDQQAIMAEDKAQNSLDLAYNWGINNISEKEKLNQEFRSMDLGGPINHGTLWNDGVILVDAGGTHESNPYGGVLMGFDEQGTPNMVEEGEVIWNDYVFSNRLNVPKDIKKKYNFKGKGGKLTFADAVKSSKQFKALEEMPNDRIAKDTFNAFISDMAASQEMERQRDMMMQYNRMANGGSLINKFSGEDTKTQQMNNDGYYYTGTDLEGFLKWIREYKQQLSPQDGKYRDAKNSRFKGKTSAEVESEPLYGKNTEDLIAALKSKETDPIRYEVAKEWIKAYNESLDGTNAGRKILDENGELKEGWEDELKEIRKHQLGTGHLGIENFDALVENYRKLKQQEATQREEAPQEAVSEAAAPEVAAEVTGDKKSPWSRIARTVDTVTDKIGNTPGLDAYDWIGLTAGLPATLATLLNRPDYSDIERYENMALSMPLVSTHPIGDYVRPYYTDVNYGANRIVANKQNTMRTLADLSGGNAATARAGLIATDFDKTTQLGDYLLNAINEEYKNNLAAATFNRGTNQYNSEDATRVDAANADIYKTRVANMVQGARDRMALDSAYSQALSANTTTQTQNLYDWAKYRKGIKMIQNDPSLMDIYKNKILASSKGGLLTVKRRGRK